MRTRRSKKRPLKEFLLRRLITVLSGLGIVLVFLVLWPIFLSCVTTVKTYYWGQPPLASCHYSTTVSGDDAAVTVQGILEGCVGK